MTKTMFIWSVVKLVVGIATTQRMIENVESG
jgi:hypothetical protein